MDGKNNGKPYFLMDDLGGKPPICRNIHMFTAFLFNSNHIWNHVSSFIIIFHHLKLIIYPYVSPPCICVAMMFSAHLFLKKHPQVMFAAASGRLQATVRLPEATQLAATEMPMKVPEGWQNPQNYPFSHNHGSGKWGPGR